jgi:hypothetical protein
MSFSSKPDMITSLFRLAISFLIRCISNVTSDTADLVSLAAVWGWLEIMTPVVAIENALLAEFVELPVLFSFMLFTSFCIITVEIRVAF